MKKIILLLSFICCTLSIHAVKLVSGSLDELKSEKFVTVQLDLSKTTFKKTKTVDDFIALAYRSRSWLEESVRCFITSFSQISHKIGLEAVKEGEVENVNYKIVIKPVNIGRDGAFNDTFVDIVNCTTQKVIATLELDVDEGDNDDEIAFRDPMNDAGEQIGDYFCSAISKIRKADKKAAK